MCRVTPDCEAEEIQQNESMEDVGHGVRAKYRETRCRGCGKLLDRRRIA